MGCDLELNGFVILMNLNLLCVGKLLLVYCCSFCFCVVLFIIILFIFRVKFCGYVSLCI